LIVARARVSGVTRICGVFWRFRWVSLPRFGFLASSGRLCI